MREVAISFNDRELLRRSNDGPSCSPENPSWGLKIHTPTINIQRNEESEWASEIYSVRLSAVSYLELSITDGGGFIKVSARLLGFGFSLSRQSTY